MPTYEYRCESCGNRYEKRESFSAPARQKCPKCGKPANRVLFAPPVVFKGSGFYKTDSRGGSADAEGDSSVPALGGDDHGHGHSHGPDGHDHASDATTESAAAS